LGSILDKVLAGERISTEDGLTLFNCPDLNALGALASIRRRQLHGNKTFYVINRHINYTNICVNGCLFCAYARKPEEDGSFKLSREDILEKLEKAPIPPVKFTLSAKLLPQAAIKAFTAVEIDHLASAEGITTVEVLKRLKTAGSEMLTGGGAEIFNPEVRAKICPEKLPGKEWLRIHGEAHELGYTTNCTMLYGHVESYADRVDHLDQLRRQQDISGGFNCLIPLPFLT
ncbi:F420, menaquinone cofactor biosynthesis like protein, partial [Aduncisulcus paluster]